VTDALFTDTVATSQLPRTWVWGIPLTGVNFAEAVAQINQLVALGQPNFVITANLHYAMLSAGDERMQANNSRAAMVLADGMPIVWASRWRERPLPERVAGADLVPAICELAARKGYTVYLLGAGPGVGNDAKAKLVARFPELHVVGVHSPPFRTLSADEELSLIDDIRAAKPDLLFVAFGQPKGEHWVAENCERLGVPVAMQIGATLDFIAGRVKRAPKSMQRIGCEWLYRFTTDPMRLGGRYVLNSWFATKMLLRDLLTRRQNRR
jgi:N-acetylglucosaminyldiphosphoundecaprenol N-acetyl-beta-D-mannosaminyltransferase